MLLLLALPVIVLVALTHRLLQTYAPSNVLSARVRACSTVRMAVGLTVLALVLVLVAHALGVAIDNGAPGWVNLFVLVLTWDAIKVALCAIQVAARWFLERVRYGLAAVDRSR
jgi:hypothetical protein